jgi:methionyl-tRNA formyltransferase
MRSDRPLRVGMIGCVQFSELALEAMCLSDSVEVCLVITRSASPMNSDFCDLTAMAAKFDVPVQTVRGNDQNEISERLAPLKLDIIFCLGWSYLLKESILSLPKYGVVGYHPAALPENRGRHPLIWALALGLERTASTFFLMDEGADSGPILSQRDLPIPSTWYADDLYQAMCSVAIQQLRDLLNAGDQPFIDAQPQPKLGNVWRKRSKADGEIDWRMSAQSIRNLVRALGHPYPGAHFVYEGRDVIVRRAELAAFGHDNLEPGKILRCEADRFCIKCGQGALWISELSEPIELTDGEYL